MRSYRGNGVVNAAAAIDGFAPGLKGAVAFEGVEDRIDNTFAYGDNCVSAGADRLDDFIAVHLLLLKEAEDEEFRNAVHEVRIGLAGRHRGAIIP